VRAPSTLTLSLCVALAASQAHAQHAPNPIPWGVLDDKATPATPGAEPRIAPSPDASAPALPPSATTDVAPRPLSSTLRLSRLTYSPGAFAEQCPPRQDIVALVVRHLGYDPFGEPAAQIVLLSIEGDDAPAQARIDLLDTERAPIGSRVVDAAEGCQELVATAALQLAIALDPLARPNADPDDVPERPESGPVAPPPPLEVPKPAPAETPPVEPSPEPGPLFDAELFMAAGMHVAGLIAPEGAMLGGTLGVGSRWTAVSMRVEGRFDISGDERGMTSFPMLATLMPCAHLPLLDMGSDGTVELTGCLTATAGVMPVIGVYQGFGVYAGSGGRVSVDWRFVDEITLKLYGQIEAAALRPTVTAPASGNVYEAPGFNLLGGIGMDLPDVF